MATQLRRGNFGKDPGTSGGSVDRPAAHAARLPPALTPVTVTRSRSAAMCPVDAAVENPDQPPPWIITANGSGPASPSASVPDPAPRQATEDGAAGARPISLTTPRLPTIGAPSPFTPRLMRPRSATRGRSAP